MQRKTFPDLLGFQKISSIERLEKMKARRDRKIASKENIYINNLGDQKSVINNSKKKVSWSVDNSGVAHSLEDEVPDKRKNADEHTEDEKKNGITMENYRKIDETLKILILEMKKKNQKRYEAINDIQKRFSELVQDDCESFVFNFTYTMTLNGASIAEVRRWTAEVAFYVKQRCYEFADDWLDRKITVDNLILFLGNMKEELKDKAGLPMDIYSKRFRFLQNKETIDLFETKILPDAQYLIKDWTISTPNEKKSNHPGLSLIHI